MGNGTCFCVTFRLLQLCVILEPMQELMSRHKVYHMGPRDCLKTTLFQKWQRMVAPPGELSPNPAHHMTATPDHMITDDRKSKRSWYSLLSKGAAAFRWQLGKGRAGVGRNV
jgi:hypothetical protein